MEPNDASADRPVSGSTGSTTADSAPSGQSAGFSDRAREIAGSTQDRLADVGSTVRERAGTAKDSLADALESGAEKLRQRMHGGQAGGSGQTGSGGQLAGATAVGAIAVDDGRVTAVGERVAGGMQATADWIRDADLDGLKSGIERQVKEHPGRTLAIAIGLGYLLGKAFRK